MPEVLDKVFALLCTCLPLLPVDDFTLQMLLERGNLRVLLKSTLVYMDYLDAYRNGASIAVGDCEPTVSLLSASSPA